MAKMLVCYYSRSGHTRKMAEEVAAGAGKVSGVSVDLKSVEQIKADDLMGYDAIMIGSPTYYGSMAAAIKQLFDDSVAFHGQLDCKMFFAGRETGEPVSGKVGAPTVDAP